MCRYMERGAAERHQRQVSIKSISETIANCNHPAKTIRMETMKQRHLMELTAAAVYL